MTATAIDTNISSFEKIYFSLRKKEGRIYSDEELYDLPNIAKDHPFYTEWQARNETCKRLKHYFEKKLSPLDILDIGCGNGWLTRHLAAIPGSMVTGVDLNAEEIKQASRVFNHMMNLQFIDGDIHAKELEDTRYDLIVFAASIQYFSSFKEIISQALRKLKANGEIHIIDSQFYKPSEISSAKERTARYYNKLGIPEMTGYYFHHSMDELNSFRFKILYQPSFFGRISNHKNPFPWLCIKKQ